MVGKIILVAILIVLAVIGLIGMMETSFDHEGYIECDHDDRSNEDKHWIDSY